MESLGLGENRSAPNGGLENTSGFWKTARGVGTTISGMLRAVGFGTDQRWKMRSKRSGYELSICGFKRTAEMDYGGPRRTGTGILERPPVVNNDC